jgi:hypothetical protein
MTPSEHARTAAEGVRALNHATAWRQGYEFPSDVDAVLVELHLMVLRLDQALKQAGDWLTRAEADDRVGHDQGGDPATAVRDITDRLNRAGAGAYDLAADLDSVRQLTAHLTGFA